MPYVRVVRQIRKPKPIGDGICELELTQGKVGLISEADAERVGVCNWRLATGKRDSYEYARGYPFGANNPALRLHKFILDTSELVDHVNRNGLDNRRENLRVVTVSQNHANRRMFKNKRVPFKGVSLCKNLYRATCNGIVIGTFLTAIEAAKAYDQAALHFGEYAATNASLGLLEAGK